MGTNNLEERVRNLEFTRTVVITLCVIFGISGAWGYHLLDSARKELNTLKNPTDEFYRIEQQYLGQFKTDATSESTTQFANFKANLRNAQFVSVKNEKGECQITAGVQMCWGAALGNTDNGESKAHFDFAAAFDAEPFVSFSVTGAQTHPGQKDNDYYEFAALQQAATSKDADIAVEEVRGRNAWKPQTTLRYIAIGKPLKH